MISDYVKNWLIKADHDLDNAEIILNNENKNKQLSDTICFHCQQAVEKYLKVYLINNNIKYPKTHDLFLLLEQCGLFDKQILKIDIGNLNNYSVDIRYPDDFYQPAIEEAKIAFDIACKIKKYILDKINFKP